MKLGMIFARARNGVIGKDGVMPWHLPEDLAHFKRVTPGCPVIMGRKTWDSLPPRFRPLPGRRNIVVTRNTGWSAAGVERVHSLEQALALVEGASHAWVIGGADIYKQALGRAEVVEATEIDAEYEGDAYAPELGAEWTELERDAHVSASGVPFTFVTYGRGRLAD
ncbi:dihydrofolate reductase [Ramlibacter terrae]|uniref:Dihydrofolate reductase n=1 Tax=Ramlibacter terrae TaxID=2732511 RepID=A0ABX6P211_9BURK|nr:dihydrofolate reductase [Ramlibacter terrae]